MPLPPTNVQGPLSLQTPAPIQIAKYARNGLVPHAVFETELANSLDFAAASRTKNLFTWSVPIASIPASTYSPRVRWRFAAHTGPVLRRIRAMVYLAKQNSGDPISTAAGCTLYITNADGSTVYGSDTFYFGNDHSAAVADTPSEWGYGELIVGGVPADTDVYGRFEDGDGGGRLISCTVFEESKKLLTGNGYVLPPGVAVSSPIYDARRQTEYELASTLWKRGAAHLWNWTVDDQASPQTRSSSTPINLIDNSSTTVSTSTPGATLDLRYCRTRALATVPCVMKVYAKTSAGTNGDVILKDSGGATVATISGGWSTTAGWKSVSFNAVAAEAKLDLQFASDGLNTFSVYAASILQYA